MEAGFGRVGVIGVIDAVIDAAIDAVLMQYLMPHTPLSARHGNEHITTHMFCSSKLIMQFYTLSTGIVHMLFFAQGCNCDMYYCLYQRDVYRKYYYLKHCV